MTGDLVRVTLQVDPKKVKKTRQIAAALGYTTRAGPDAGHGNLSLLFEALADGSLRAKKRGAMSEAQMVDFGSWFDAQLSRRGWTRHYFAQSSGIVTSTVYKWKANEQRPSPKHCVAIAEALGLDLDLVLAAAGHRVHRDHAPGVVRAELRRLLDRIPEDLLIPLVPMLRGLTDITVQQETQRRLHQPLLPEEDHDA